jgi:two-component system, LytTR family, sensor kinase
MDRNEGLDGLVQAFRRARWGWIAAVWGAIYTFEAARHLVNTYFNGRPPSKLWLAVSATSIATWAVLTPLMLWLGRRAPLDRDDRARRAAIHVAALLMIVALDAALQARLWGYRGTSTFTSLFFTLMVVDGFSYATVVAIAHVHRANALYRERVRAQAALDRELTGARLRALEMQLQPHFLFNTLHAVGALVRSDRPDDAVRSLATLGGLLRATLTGGDQHEIALGEEIALAHRYLELQKIRFADRLQVDVEIAPDVERARVPRLILQPLLENAVRHGVERSRTTVAIEVRAVARGERLELTVRDHGGVREAASPGQGIGLANTRARLATLYGTAHRFEPTPTEGGGLAIRIEIPLVLAPAATPAPLELELEGELEATT